MNDHKVVSREEWTAARIDLLAKEKELTRMRDKLSQQRRELPWVRVDKEYMFDGPHGTESLADLFEGRTSPRRRRCQAEWRPRILFEGHACRKVNRLHTLMRRNGAACAINAGMPLGHWIELSDNIH